ncbi:MAG: AsnC family transcriptional regulator [Candidatus Hydrogenedentes bacterium]|nr:AsnC family transcriptional regulator [Candidatus Hydrogenedentota bacterium]
MSLDDLDRRILDAAQSAFPLESRPFAALARRLGSTEHEVLSRLRGLRESGLIRELGPVFDLRRLGYTSTLCAARVAEPFIDPVAQLLDTMDEVTHNYLRDDPFNMWFTVIAPSPERIESILARIRSADGVGEVLSLPVERTFKINVQFDIAKDAP